MPLMPRTPRKVRRARGPVRLRPTGDAAAGSIPDSRRCQSTRGPTGFRGPRPGCRGRGRLKPPLKDETGAIEKLDGGHSWLSETPDRAGSKGWDGSLPRMVSWVKLRGRADPEA